MYALYEEHYGHPRHIALSHKLLFKYSVCKGQPIRSKLSYRKGGFKGTNIKMVHFIQKMT